MIIEVTNFALEVEEEYRRRHLAEMMKFDR